MLPYTYGVYSDFVTSSVKSEIKLVNAEEFVSVCVTVKSENWNCCSTSRFASIFDVPLSEFQQMKKNTTGLFVLLLL